MRNKTIIIIGMIFISLILNINGYSNVGKISGYVFDSISEKPVHYAEITLKNINMITYSDTSGYFVFDSVAIGDYILSVEYYCYLEYTIKINTETLTSDLIIKLKKLTDNFPYTHLGKHEQNVSIPILVLSDKNVEHALDTVIIYMNKYRENFDRKYILKFDKSYNSEKLVVISLINTTYDLDSIPNGVLKYNGSSFYVYGDYFGKLRKKFGKESKENVNLLLYEIKSLYDTIEWHFKQTKRGFEIIKIIEYNGEFPRNIFHSK